MRIQIKEAIVASVILVSGWNCATEKPPIEREYPSACATEKPSVMRECPSIDAGDYYFPSDVDEFIRNWYSKHLRAMQEPSLSCGKRQTESAYRFLWLRTFHHPISVRIEKDSSSAILYAVELDGAGGYAPGRIAKQVHKTLSSAEQERLMTELNKIWFWGMPRYMVSGGLDGAEWILEGTSNGQYQVMKEWSPRIGAYRDVCLLFLELAGFSIPAAETY